MKNGTFRIATSSDSANLFVYQNVSNSGLELFSYTYDTLLNYTPRGKLESQLAWRWSETSTRVTFFLRRGIRCADGTTLTARDVAADFDYVLDAKNASPWLGVAVPPSGATVTASNQSRTVTIRDTAPDSLLLQTTGPLMPIACPAVLAHPSAYLHKTDGTGPYKLTSASPGDSYSLTRRRDYHWGPGGASTSTTMPKYVTMEVIPDETTQTDLLFQGELNAVELVGPNRTRLTHASGVTLDKVPGQNFWLWFNQRTGHVTDSPVVRKALTLAVNLKTLEKVATGNLGDPAKSLVPYPTNPCRYNSVSGSFPSSSMDGAKRLLRQDGWRAGAGGVLQKNGKALDITLPDETDAGASVEAMNEYLQHEWDLLGADVTLVPTTLQGLIGIIFGPGNWDSTMVGIGVDVPSQLIGFLSGPTPPAGENFSGIHSESYVVATAAAEKAVGTTSCRYWKEAEKILFRSYDLIPFADNPVYVGLKDARATVSFPEIYPTSIRLIAKN